MNIVWFQDDTSNHTELRICIPKLYINEKINHKCPEIGLIQNASREMRFPWKALNMFFQNTVFS